MALGNIALDLLGHARSFLHFAGTWDGRSEDDLAYFRDEPEFRSAWIMEQPNGDFAQTIARQLVASVYLVELYAGLRASSEPTLAAIAEKALKEVDYHRDHAVQWVLRLAGGTEESRRRMIRALADVWPYVDELFRDEPLIDRLGDAAVRPSTLRAPFDAVIATVFAEAELAVPPVAASSAGGRNGAHATPSVTSSPRCRCWRDGIRGVMVTRTTADVEAQAWRIAAAVPDPEVPVLTIEDLGVLRAVELRGERVVVDITPTYSGCPAMDTIRDDVVLALTAAGFADVEVRLVLSPRGRRTG